MECELTIEINALRIRAFHGVMPQEAVVGNDFEVTVHVRYPAGSGVDRDDLAGTLNYAEACTLIREVMAKRSMLLEHVCGRLQKALLERFPLITGGMVRVAKLTPPVSGVQLESVAVSLKW